MVMAGFDDQRLVDVDDRRQRCGGGYDRRNGSGGIRIHGREPDQTGGCQAKGQENFHEKEAECDR